MMELNTESIWVTLARLYSDETQLERPLTGIEQHRKIVLDYVWNEMKRHAEDRPPFIADDRSHFVKSRRVTIEDFDVKNSHGCLLPTSQGFTLLVKKGLDDFRRRGVLAHELGHTFLFDLSQTPPKMYNSQTLGPEWRNVEGPAYEIGRQILLPEACLTAQEYGRTPSIENLYELRRIFRASSYILSRRLVHDLHLWDVCVLIAESDPAISVKGKFRGRSFSHFNIRQNFEKIRPLLVEASENVGEVNDKTLTIGQRTYDVQSNCTNLGTIVSIIREARST